MRYLAALEPGLNMNNSAETVNSFVPEAPLFLIEIARNLAMDYVRSSVKL